MGQALGPDLLDTLAKQTGLLAQESHVVRYERANLTLVLAIRQLVQVSHQERFRHRIVFIEDYDIEVARHLVQGVDVWLNTPRRPLEASGTSGMKVCPNGGINLSILDGWWPEAYDGSNGWAIGEERETIEEAYPGDVIGMAFGLPSLAGAFGFTLIAQLAAATIYFLFLRPDPLLLSKLNAERTGHTHDHLSAEEKAEIPAPQLRNESAWRIIRSRPVALIAMLSMAFANATMVLVMSMTPVHLSMMEVALPLIGLTVSLHTAGMYGLSPIFGWLSDRFGRISVIVFGQLMLVGALVANTIAPDDMTAVVTAMVLLGLGWSASTVAGSALLTESVTPEDRTTVQGLSDTVMSLTGAASGALAGLTLALIGFGPLNSVTIASTVVVMGVVLLVRSRTRTAPTA